MDIPEDVKKKAETLWMSIRALVDVKRENEPEITQRIAANLMMEAKAKPPKPLITQRVRKWRRRKGDGEGVAH
jgi:hypothetical protein